MGLRQNAGIAGVALVALVIPGTALADRQKVQLTPAGEAKARVAVVRRADLGPTRWRGEVSEQGGGGGDGPKCSGYEPKQSDLVRVGAAAAVWKSNNNVTVFGESAVLRTPAMALLAWQRIFRPEPAFIRCARRRWASDATSTALPLSYEKLHFPPLAARIRGYRIKTQYRNDAGKTVPAVLDAVFIERGRTMTTMVFIARASLGQAVHRDEIRAAGRIVERMATRPVG